MHPAAEIVPRMTDAEYRDLRADIAANGLREPVWTYQGELLDGRHRMQACAELGVPCPTRDYTGDDPVAFVVSLNVKRRNLTASQLAYVALDYERVEALLAKERQGSRTDLVQQIAPSSFGKARDKAAQAVGVNHQYVSDAKNIEKQDADLAARIKAGEKTITQAKRELKEERRNERRAENAGLIAAAPSVADAVGSARFATIVIDPPWDWGDEGDVDQLGRARTTYNALSFDELLVYPVGEAADVDAHLYLWITNRSLPKGFALLERWGFRYVTCLTWCKPHYGMGNYFRGQTEHVLFGVKGSQALKRKDVGTWFAAPRGPLGHSSKPLEFYDLVESCSPGPYLEMFARSERAGWTSWGVELAAA